jgi:acyl carrier protein
MDITEKLTPIFREVFDDDSLVVSDDMTADDVDGWDSLSHVNLLIAIEIAFDIEFKQNEIQSFANVGELEKCIIDKLHHKE